jgi:hypothetical protein
MKSYTIVIAGLVLLFLLIIIILLRKFRTLSNDLMKNTYSILTLVTFKASL